VKTNVLITIVIAVGSAALGAFAGAFVTGFVCHHEQAEDIAMYLPAQPRANGVKIGGSAVRLAGSVASRSFRFTAASVASAAEAAQLMEPQLVSEGWEKLSSSNDSAVASSSWRHREKINRGLYLVFAVAQLDTRGEYLGSMTTAPYWRSP
jgi:hypothetical protein